MISETEKKLVKMIVKKCIKTLKRKDYELNLPKDVTEVALQYRKIQKRSCGRNLAGANLIQIDLGYWQIGNEYHIEYKSYDKDPVIGKIYVNCKLENHLWVSIAHEVSHHIQFRYAPRINRFSHNWRKPHGDCFKTLYRYLRKDLVNPLIKENL